MKKLKHIGFIDYFIDEWHANNYPAWIRENIRCNGRNMALSYAWAEMDKPGGLDTESWCEKNNVKRISSVDELVEKSDYIIVLSPDNPEHHENLSKIPLMSGKPVYIDKTFSPDLATGIRLFDLAKKYKTPMFSSSALRFSKELSLYPSDTVNRETLEYVATTGEGNYENYSVHQFEMIVSLMGTGAKRMKSLSSDSGRLLVVDYNDGRHSSIFQMQKTPFQVSAQLKNDEGLFIGQCSDIFEGLIDAILEFFETGNSPVPYEETLEIMALREAGFQALKKYDTWIDLPQR